ncbi:putative hydrolase YxeP [Hartmannibacter diazotrophicus]|uniref:Putative hydrolase YxeP n=1 Tax=Hartmannibacter diazotrophicus TaxID=1482074 RepID=A0A2C9D493_9HYPH|nr:M20 aminoacylase family protein [Hartmannibacter diazotrophicus]SON54591.1 putative hydrolase YxeP [Hartmannibacter diazotrophicus]
MNKLVEIKDLLPALVELRRDFHRHPELGFKEHRTAARVADELRALGLEVTTGVGGTGVVGVLRNGSSDRAVGLRADMDALPIVEATGLPYASQTPGVFHGCGHDGHTTMLLGTARHLARTKRFDGTVIFIFQPAEEGLGGGKAMVEDGLFERFPMNEVYALHNWPDLPAGTAATMPGPFMAAADVLEISVKGKGGHAAMPHETPDAILAASQLVAALHTLVSRRIHPADSAVLSISTISGGMTNNVLPGRVDLTGTVRTFDPAVQARIEQSIRSVAAGIGIATETTIDVEYRRGYPPTVNDPTCAEWMLEAAGVAGLKAELATKPSFGAEDFSYLLEHCPGAYLWLGQGRTDDEPPLHHASYDFNDDVIGDGIAVFTKIVEGRLSASD